MSLIVQKYGGSSVANIDRIESVAERITRWREQGKRLVIVVSAMAGETDRLLDLARAISHPNRPNPRELDALLSSGETTACTLLCMALEKRGVTARSLQAAQAGIYSSGSHFRARINDIDTGRVNSELDSGRIPIVAGFQAINEAGDVTTLGRGGTDTTAVAMAAAMDAEECQIYKDVDGVYTTDPKIAPEARRLTRLTHEEMLELAGQGSKVVQNRAVEFAGKYNVSIRVLSSFIDGPGTLITRGSPELESARIAGIAFNRDEALITVAGAPAGPGTASEILGPVADAEIEVDMIVQTTSREGLIDLSFTLHRDRYAEALDILRARKSGLDGASISGNGQVAKLALVGVGLRSHADVASQMFRTLADCGITVHMVSTSEIKVAVLIDEEKIEEGV
ncbi:MAG: aspartate kinase, partial [Gammaproteobacteria bacterium]